MRKWIAILGLICCSGAWAQTEVSGNVSGSWDVSGNPYLVVGDLTVPGSQFLNVNPGVEIRFMGNYKMTVNGGLNVIGTSTDSVKFIYNPEQSGRWKYIEFNNALPGANQLSYCLIETAERAVYVISSSVSLQYCLIQDHTSSPVKGQNAQITMVSCVVTNNQQSGLALQNTSINLQDCWITYNSGLNGHGINASNGGNLQISGGYIGNNVGTGIYGLEIGTVTLNYVEIAQNSHEGISLTNSGELTAIRVCVHDNLNDGIFLSLTSMDARNLTISSNEEYGIFCSNATLTLSSSIVDRNGNWGIYCQSATSFVSYNNVYDNDAGSYSGCTPGTGSIEEDPSYVSYTNRDFNLSSDSPCIDTGSIYDPLDPDGTRTDMGAFYYNQTPVKPENGAATARSFEISRLYPNPFNPLLKLTIQAIKPQSAVLSAWSADGRRIATIWGGILHPGGNEIAWNAQDLPSALYLIQLEADGVTSTVRCVLLK
ncbi:MAG: right-handed parallel beta-helix repeat-containing protein [bacterium]